MLEVAVTIVIAILLLDNGFTLAQWLGVILISLSEMLVR